MQKACIDAPDMEEREAGKLSMQWSSLNADRAEATNTSCLVLDFYIVIIDLIFGF